MKLLTQSLLFCFLIPFSFLSQSVSNSNNSPKEVQLIFKPGKTKVTAKHKKILDEIESELSDGDEVYIYPLSTYKKKKTKSAVSTMRQKNTTENIWFDPKSKEQANEIINYLLSKNNSKIELEDGFSYRLKGPSVRIKISLDYYAEPIAHNGKKKRLTILEEGLIPMKDYFPEKESQFFIIDPNEDTLIEGKEGTKLFFARGCLLSKELVQIELKEFYKPSDFLKAELQTVSNGKMLFTGGTIYLDARKKSDLKTQVQINPSRGINAEFTEGKNDPDMQVFVKDKTSKETNWLISRRYSWRYTRNYMLNKNETYRTYVFNSPNDYQEYVTSGEAKKVEEEWIGVLREIARAKREAARIKAYEKQKKEWKRIRNNDEAVISRLSINQLGFINADKFVDTLTENFEMFADKSRKASYYIVFEGNNKGILKGFGSDKISFGKVPVGQPATIIGISITKKGKYIYKKRINSTSEELGEVTLASADDDEINKVLSSIN